MILAYFQQTQLAGKSSGKSNHKPSWIHQEILKIISSGSFIALVDMIIPN